MISNKSTKHVYDCILTRKAQSNTWKENGQEIPQTD
jgi:hypothetical protein